MPALRRWGGGYALGLRAKLVALTIAVTLISSLTLFGLFFGQLREQERTAGIQRLSAVAQLHAEAIGAVFRLMETDAEVLAHTPPILGLLGTDPQPEPDWPPGPEQADAWKLRLERVFSSVLTARTHYTQLRLIGRADAWRELVRVDRRGAHIAVIPPEALQVKGGEPYLSPSRNLSRSEAYFSEVTYNRERGQIEGPPTIRLVRPLRDRNGDLFGAIVINADYGALLNQAAPQVGSGFHATAITDTLDWLSYGGEGANRLHFHLDPDWVPPPNAGAIAFDAPRARTVHTPEAMLQITPVFVQRNGRPFGLFVETAIAHSDLFAASRRALRQTSVVALCLIVICAGGAVLVAQRITQPVRELTDAVRRGDTTSWPRRRRRSHDEIGALAEILGGDLARETVQRRAILASVHDGIITISEQGIIEDVNPATEELFGYSRAEMLGRGVEMLMPSTLSALHRGFVTGATTDPRPHAMAGNRDIFGCRKDGTQIPLEISVSRAVYAHRTHFIGVVRDISIRKTIEEQTNLLLEALERSNQELDKFAYVASHDLRAPLRVIDNASRWLEEDLSDHFTDDTRESMALLRSRVVRMERLLDDLLQHSRIGRTREAIQPIPGATLITELGELLIPRPGIRFHATPAVAAIELPRMPILTVLLNLVNNAIKHHDRDQGEVTLDVSEDETGFDFTVTDDGPGIPPEYHARIFEMFQTLRPRDEVDGSGMGLAMVLKHVTVVGGRIAVASEGRGTTFRLRWPKRATLSEPREEAA